MISSFEEVFLNALTAAKAQHKKILLLVNDFDDTPAGINPIITNLQRRDEVIKILTHCKSVTLCAKNLIS
jgi:hypothetical protein